MRSRYSFSEPSAAWPDEFAREAETLRGLLDGELREIHHIGSTSVPGLAAKPIIDVLPLVRAIGRIDGLSPRFEEAGYQGWGEYGLVGRRFFTKDQAGVRTHNVHIYEVDHPDAERHLAFCAYLRAHREACREYESLKRDAYRAHPAEIEAYNAHKDAWIKRAEILAVAWWRNSG